MKNSGYIYVLINKSMENLVKVGKTTRDAESRARELSSVTGVPTPFTVAFDAFFEDCSGAEDYIHKELEQKGYRLASNREFFEAPLKEVISVIVQAQQVLKPQQTATESTNSQTELADGEQPDDESNERNEPWTQVESLANYYLNSLNFKEGYRLYKKALSLGSKNAFYFLGDLTFRGAGCIEDEQQAIEYFRKGVEAGDSRCCAELSLRYFHKEDYATGLEWFERYLQSKNLHSDDRLPSHVFHCCWALEFSRGGSESIMLKYGSVLRPFKDEIVDYAIGRVAYAKRRYPDLKPSYLKVAQVIDKCLE